MGGSAPTGRCLCGGVVFTVDGPLRDVTNCHCHRCRRFTGHHMAASDADVVDLQITDPEQLLTWFYPVPEAGYGFCGRCGSSLFWRSEDAKRMTICAGVLDPPTGLRTVAAWWISEASDYHERPDVREYATEP
jgi:hypothetical protein